MERSGEKRGTTGGAMEEDVKGLAAFDYNDGEKLLGSAEAVLQLKKDVTDKSKSKTLWYRI